MVVDTPGLFDTKRSNEETISEIIKCYGITAPGLHAILLIQDVGRMTDEQIKTIEIFEERFGKNLDRFLILVFTGKDKLTSQRKTLNEYVHGLQTDSNLKKLLKRIDYRFTGLSLSGDQKDLEDEINDLMGMVQSLVDKNEGQYYTNDMYHQAEQVLLERLAEVKRKEKERHDKEIEDALRNEREKHAGIEQSLQDEIQRKENELAKQKKKDDFFDKAKKEWERFRRRGISW
ncbi:hypothetical protein FSP39_011840 [Pinctada imbricata]|uniref:AIG1-type G domain-containing protein n=1 Tax=Pinctada imbricata TaxID=66713 RepID=A0AA88YMF9_PINIB|nr:hypothetical protein FSP39_011840 [Pinctada imbricata]